MSGIDDNSIRAILGSLPMRDQKRRKGVSISQVKKIAQEAAESVVTGYPEYEASATTLATQATGVEDAWTTISAGAPNGARFAIIQFEAYSDSDADNYLFEFRQQAGAQAVRVIRIDPTATADSSDQNPIEWYFVPLASGNFDYQVTSTAGSLNWTIRRLGYW